MSSGLQPDKANSKSADLPKPRSRPVKPKPGRRSRERRSVTAFVTSSGLDYGALGRIGHAAWSTLLLDYLDWLEDRACRHDLPRQLSGPCDTPGRIVKRVNRAHWRQTNPQRALDDLHVWCVAAVWPQQPGAPRAVESCSGCIFGFPDLTEPDNSMLDAFGDLKTPRAIADQVDLYARVARLMGRRHR